MKKKKILVFGLIILCVISILFICLSYYKDSLDIPSLEVTNNEESTNETSVEDNSMEEVNE